MIFGRRGNHSAFRLGRWISDRSRSTAGRRPVRAIGSGRRRTWAALSVVAAVLLVALAGVQGPAAHTTTTPASAIRAPSPPAVSETSPVIASADAITPAPTSPMYYVSTRKRVMGLTFDISWGTKAVGDVLGVLKDHQQRATFFLSGPWSQQHPEIVADITKGGHEIASHGQAHVNLSQRSDGEIGQNLDDADAILNRLTGQDPRFFRPPNGDFDSRVVQIAAARGQETVIWSIDSLDWLKRDPKEIARRVIAGAFPGAVILFHASDSAPTTAQALPIVFRTLASMGYTLVPLGELLADGPIVREDPRGRPQKPNMDAAGR